MRSVNLLPSEPRLPLASVFSRLAISLPSYKDILQRKVQTRARVLGSGPEDQFHHQKRVTVHRKGRNDHEYIYYSPLWKPVHYSLQYSENCCLFRKCDTVIASLESRDLRGFGVGSQTA